MTRRTKWKTKTKTVCEMDKDRGEEGKRVPQNFYANCKIFKVFQMGLESGFMKKDMNEDNLAR